MLDVFCMIAATSGGTSSPQMKTAINASFRYSAVVENPSNVFWLHLMHPCLCPYFETFLLNPFRLEYTTSYFDQLHSLCMGLLTGMHFSAFPCRRLLWQIPPWVIQSTDEQAILQTQNMINWPSPLLSNNSAASQTNESTSSRLAQIVRQTLSGVCRCPALEYMLHFKVCGIST